MIIEEPHHRNICAVVVAYHPPPDFFDRVMLISERVRHVIVVDNGSSASIVKALRDISSRPNIGLILNERNLGIAAALNQGIRLAASRSFHWVLTLDQDSEPCAGMIEDLISARNDAPSRSRVALVAPVYLDSYSGRAELDDLCGGRKSAEIMAAITSGSLLATPAFFEAGPFREDFFIDYVDFEYCLRLRKASFSILRACDARLLHSVGRSTVHEFLGKTHVITNHPPLRRYYITRNRLLTIKAYATRETAWSVEQSRAVITDFAKMLLFESERMSKVRYFFKGVLHAALGRTGELQDLAN